jgi:hypothetical protein
MKNCNIIKDIEHSIDCLLARLCKLDASDYTDCINHLNTKFDLIESLTYRHYNACIKRGVITPDTDIGDFVKKLIEEYHEFLESIPYPPILDCKAKQELIDLIMVALNMLKFFDIDIKEELLKNVLTQEKRAGNN